MAKTKGRLSFATAIWRVVKWDKDRSFLKITCPYCLEYCLVKRSWAERLVARKADPDNPVELWTTGRSCPYCMKIGQLPENAPGHRDQNKMS